MDALEELDGRYAGSDLLADLEAEHRQERGREQGQQIREWAAAYHAWNEQEIARRRAEAVRQSWEEKLAVFLDLYEAVRRIAPEKSQALYWSQMQAHQVVQERIMWFERCRSHGKPST